MKNPILSISFTAERVNLALPGDPGSIHIYEGDYLSVCGEYSSLNIDCPGVGIAREIPMGLQHRRVRSILRREAKHLGFLRANRQARQLQAQLNLPNVRVSSLPEMQKELLYVVCAIARGHTIVVTEDFAAGLSPEAYIQVTKIIKELIQEKEITAFISISQECYSFESYNKIIYIP